MPSSHRLSKAKWIEMYGGQAVLDREGFDVVPCVNCDDSICHGWRVVPRQTVAMPTNQPECRACGLEDHPHQTCEQANMSDREIVRAQFAEQAAELARVQEELRKGRWILGEIMGSLPHKRDWLDPAVERCAKDLLRENP